MLPQCYTHTLPGAAVSFLSVVDDDCLLTCKKEGLVAIDFGDPTQQICVVALNGRDWWGKRAFSAACAGLFVFRLLHCS